MSVIDVRARIPVAHIASVVKLHHPDIVIPEKWPDDAQTVDVRVAYVDVDDALDALDQGDIDDRASGCDCDEDRGGVADTLALADFVERLLCGDVATARVLAARAFDNDDLEVVERAFAGRGRAAPAMSMGAGA